MENAMFLFYKLYLAHLIGDFILQFEELYQLKLKSIVGHILHVVIHAGVSLLLVFPYLKYPSVWIFVFVITGIHFFQDRIKYRLQQNVKIMFLCFVADQILHAVFLTAILLVPASRVVLGFPELPKLDIYYQDNNVTLFLIALVLATFTGSYLFHAFRTSYIPGTRKNHGITSFEMFHGIFERGAVLVIFLFSSQPLLFAASPAVGILRLLSNRLASWLDFAISFIYAALLGVLFRSLLTP